MIYFYLLSSKKSAKTFVLNKQKFRQVVSNYRDLSVQDRIDLHDLVKDHPYSQILHTLVAKANHDAKTDIVRQSLNYAAMYASDRSVLKDIIQSEREIKEHTKVKRSKNLYEPGNKKNEISQPQEESGNDIIPVKKGKGVTVDTNELLNSSDDLIKEVWKDLADLKKSKANYMAHALSSSENPQKTTSVRKVPSRSTTTTNKSSSTAKSKSSAPQASTVKSSSKKKQTPAKTDYKVAKAKASPTVTKSKSTGEKDTSAKSSEATNTPALQKKNSKTTAKQSNKKITTTKKKVLTEKLSPESQSELIERFIDKEPRISAKTIKATEADQTDLSEKSTVYSEDLISENLAQILLAQGKKEKAVDIYKKLIWKFPQKKSYFAAQIEEIQR